MKATIVIPNINGKGWLKDSIESVYAQTEQDFELIVVDNGSTDESLEQARGYCTRAFPMPSIRALPGPGASLWCSSTMMPLPSPGGWQN